MPRNLLETDWFSTWMARNVLKRAQRHLAQSNDPSASILGPLIQQLTPATAGELWQSTVGSPFSPQSSLFLLWRVHRRLLSQNDLDAASTVFETVRKFFE